MADSKMQVLKFVIAAFAGTIVLVNVTKADDQPGATPTSHEQSCAEEKKALAAEDDAIQKLTNEKGAKSCELGIENAELAERTVEFIRSCHAWLGMSDVDAVNKMINLGAQAKVLRKLCARREPTDGPAVK